MADRILIMPLYSCAVKVKDNEIFSSALLPNGEIGKDWSEVTTPESPVFVEIVNSYFGTEFAFSSL